MEVGGQAYAPATLSVGKEPPVPLNGRLCGPRAALDVLEKRKISCLCWALNPVPSSQ
jgi:hypothetical protein